MNKRKRLPFYYFTVKQKSHLVVSENVSVSIIFIEECFRKYKVLMLQCRINKYVLVLMEGEKKRN